jgi:CBS domain-containing protein
MTRELVACHPGDELARAERLMAASRKSRIVVLDQRSLLVGVVSLSEIAKHDAANAGAVVARVVEREVPRPAIRARPIASAPRARETAPGLKPSQVERAAADRAIRDALHVALLAQETP